MQIPDDHADSMAEQREQLIGQMRYLIEEARALGPLLENLPTDVLETSPPDGFSVRETLRLLAECDEQIFSSWLHRIIAEEVPELQGIDEQELVETAVHVDADASIAEILTAIRHNREELTSFLENLPPHEWSREGITSTTASGSSDDDGRQTIYDIAYFIGQHDFQHLRRLGQMMHSTNLTDGEDLPK